MRQAGARLQLLLLGVEQHGHAAGGRGALAARGGNGALGCAVGQVQGRGLLQAGGRASKQAHRWR